MVYVLCALRTCLDPFVGLALCRGGVLFVEPLDQHGDVSGGRVSELPHEGYQHLRVTGLAEEGVVEELGGGGALGGVADKHLV